MADLTAAEYAALVAVERAAVGAVEMTSPSTLILWDPSDMDTPAASRTQLVSVSVLASPRDYEAEEALRAYARALVGQLRGAARVSYEAQLEDAGGGSPFQTQTVAGSLETVMTTDDGAAAASRVYQVYDPTEGTGGTPLLADFVPGAVAAAQIELVRAELDAAVTAIDTLTAAAVP